MSTARTPQLWALLLVLSGNMLIDALEVSTMVIAMPSVGAEFGLSPTLTSSFMWLFAVAFGGFIVLGGRLTATLGRRRVYLAAMLVFAIASVTSGLAQDPGTLAATRVVKGICVALTAPTGLAIIGSTFEAGPQRAGALAIYSLFGASGFSTGLLLSGALTGVSWRWALAFSGPVALVLFLIALRQVPADSHPAAVIPVGGRSVRSSAEPTAGAARSANARVLRSAAGGAVLNGSLWGFLFVATFELQDQLSWSPLATGLALLPVSLPLTFATAYSGRLIDRFGAGPLITAGNVAAVAGYGWYLGTVPHRSYLPGILPAAILVGIAFTLSFSALQAQAIAGSRPSRQGSVSSVFQTSVQLGGAATLVLVALVAGPGHRSAAMVVAVAAVGLLIAVQGFVAERRTSKEMPCSLTRSASP
ncbi:MFS transporter [Geodermatophilus sp. SYSU D01176]